MSNVETILTDGYVKTRMLEGGRVDWAYPGFESVKLRDAMNPLKGGLPLIFRAIVEDVAAARLVGRVERVYIAPDLWRPIRNGRWKDSALSTALTSRYKDGKRVWKIDGIPVSMTKGQRPYYVWTGSKELQ